MVRLAMLANMILACIFGPQQSQEDQQCDATLQKHVAQTFTGTHMKKKLYSWFTGSPEQTLHDIHCSRPSVCTPVWPRMAEEVAQDLETVVENRPAVGQEAGQLLFGVCCSRIHIQKGKGLLPLFGSQPRAASTPESSVLSEARSCHNVPPHGSACCLK